MLSRRGPPSQIPFSPFFRGLFKGHSCLDYPHTDGCGLYKHGFEEVQLWWVWWRALCYTPLEPQVVPCDKGYRLYQNHSNEHWTSRNTGIHIVERFTVASIKVQSPVAENSTRICSWFKFINLQGLAWRFYRSLRLYTCHNNAASQIHDVVRSWWCWGLVV